MQHIYTVLWKTRGNQEEHFSIQHLFAWVNKRIFHQYTGVTKNASLVLTGKQSPLNTQKIYIYLSVCLQYPKPIQLLFDPKNNRDKFDDRCGTHIEQKIEAKCLEQVCLQAGGVTTHIPEVLYTLEMRFSTVCVVIYLCCTLWPNCGWKIGSSNGGIVAAEISERAENPNSAIPTCDSAS